MFLIVVLSKRKEFKDFLEETKALKSNKNYWRFKTLIIVKTLKDKTDI